MPNLTAQQAAATAKEHYLQINEGKVPVDMVVEEITPINEGTKWKVILGIIESFFNAKKIKRTFIINAESGEVESMESEKPEEKVDK